MDRLPSIPPPLPCRQSVPDVLLCPFLTHPLPPSAIRSSRRVPSSCPRPSPALVLAQLGTSHRVRAASNRRPRSSPWCALRRAVVSCVPTAARGTTYVPVPPPIPLSLSRRCRPPANRARPAPPLHTCPRCPFLPPDDILPLRCSAHSRSACQVLSCPQDAQPSFTRSLQHGEFSPLPTCGHSRPYNPLPLDLVHVFSGP